MAEIISDFYFNEDLVINSNFNVPSIIDDFDSNYPSVVDRFFTKYYYRKPDCTDEDHLVLFHSNRICLIGFAKSHIAVKKGIKSITFNIGNSDRSLNVCSGKGKKGAMNVQPNTTLALVTCNDDTEYKVLSCITGKLIEANTRLIENVSIIGEEGLGHVAVCLPKVEHCDSLKSSLLTEEQYQEAIEKN